MKLLQEKLSTVLTSSSKQIRPLLAFLFLKANELEITQSQYDIQTAIDGIEVGTRNLLRDSNVEFSFGEDDNKYIWDAYRDNTWEVLGD